MFSIIIPIYNVQTYLNDCIESILLQATKADIEVFLVDDGSTDMSSEIAQKYACDYPNLFTYIKKENGGLSDARNYAIPYASKDYIFFIDSDDYISEDAIQVLSNVVEKENPDIIIFDYYNAWDNKKTLVNLSDCNEGIINNSQYLLMNPAAWNKVIKTSIIKENNIRFPKGLWYEDRATTGNYINFGQKIYYCKNALYYYRQRENSIMKQKNYNPKMLDIIKAMQLFDQQISVSDGLYKEEKEYLFISNLLFQSALRLIPLKKYDEIKECYSYLEKKYPNWRKNKIFLEQSRGYRIICHIVSRGFYSLAKKIIEFRLRGE